MPIIFTTRGRGLKKTKGLEHNQKRKNIYFVIHEEYVYIYIVFKYNLENGWMSFRNTTKWKEKGKKTFTTITLNYTYHISKN